MKGLTLVGEWLSLVEHLVRDQGVGGSNPLSPTNYSQAVTAILAEPVLVQFVQLAILVPRYVETEASFFRCQAPKLCIGLEPFHDVDVRDAVSGMSCPDSYIPGIPDH